MLLLFLWHHCDVCSFIRQVTDWEAYHLWIGKRKMIQRRGQRSPESKRFMAVVVRGKVLDCNRGLIFACWDFRVSIPHYCVPTIFSLIKWKCLLLLCYLWLTITYLEVYLGKKMCLFSIRYLYWEEPPEKLKLQSYPTKWMQSYAKTWALSLSLIPY